MKLDKFVLFFLAICLFACSNKEKSHKEKSHKENNDYIKPPWFEDIYKSGDISENAYNSIIDSASVFKWLKDHGYSDEGIKLLKDSTILDVTKDSIQEEAYKNDLSLDIKPIKEEIEDPISEECSQLLEEYASVIRRYSELLKKIEANPDDVNLMIAKSPLEEKLDSYVTKPQFFSCSQNKAFKKQFDILNGKKDKLLYN